MRRTFLFLLSLLLALPVAAADRRPNFLFILVDDQSPFDFKFYNSKSTLQSPNIDRLAAEGMVLDGAYHMGAHMGAVCTPSRHMIMSGRTVWHLPISPNAKEHSPASLEQRTLGAVFKSAGYLTQAFTDRAIEFIEKSRDKPFFVYLAYNAVHGPNQAPKDTVARFPALSPKEAMQAAMVAELDAGIGRVLEALKKSGKTKDTLVFFLSDNGGLPYWWEGSNKPLRSFERFQYDGGNKVPFIVRWPAHVAGGQVRKQPVSALDILPTALEAAGLAAPAKEVLDGISLLPALKAGKDLQPERAIFWAGAHYEKDVTAASVGHDNPPPAWAIRRGDWKLMQILEQGGPMLFNIAADPSESSDVIAEQPKLAAELRKAWVEWFRIGGDRGRRTRR